MPEGPSYVVLGRGRWAGRMQSILGAENRSVAAIPETRRASEETDTAYRSRLADVLRASDAQIAWLCVLPGPHVPLMIDAALDAGLHVVTEKPWQASQGVTTALVAKAKSLRRLIAVHFEYCLLEEVERWRRDFHPGTGLRFGGRFFLSRPDHTGMSAMAISALTCSPYGPTQPRSPWCKKFVAVTNSRMNAAFGWRNETPA